MFAFARRPLVVVAAVLVVAPASVLAATPPSYTITDLSAYGIFKPVAINDHNVVLGDPFPFTPPDRSVLYDASTGVATPLPSLDGGPFTYGMGLNDAGQVIGSAGTQTSDSAFLYSGGRIAALPVAGSVVRINNAGTVLGTAALFRPDGTAVPLPIPNAFLAGLNDNGLVVGWYNPGPGPSHNGPYAFVYDVNTGALTNLGTLGVSPYLDNLSAAADVNDAGQVVGSSTTGAGHTHAFLYSGGVMRDLGALAGGDTYASAISELGQVVGQATTGPDPGDPMHAFLFSDGAMHDLNDMIPAGSGWTLQAATDVNDNGDIVGQGVFNGETRAFLLRPTASVDPLPLPAAFWPGLLLLSGLTVVTAGRRTGNLAAAFVR